MRDAWQRIAIVGIMGLSIMGVEGAAPRKGLPRRERMQLTTTAFKSGTAIPKKFTGEDVSPPLAWTGVPAGTQSFALIMEDPDAPPGTWVHWVLYDLPGTLRELKENTPKTETLKNGGTHGACWGVDRFDRVGYYGPCPPPGKPHRYYFRIYALDTVLKWPPKKTAAELRQAMKGHILGEGELMGTYGR